MTTLSIEPDVGLIGHPAVARLFVANNSAYSVIAHASLRAALAELPTESRPDLMVIDVLRNPTIALQYHVYVTPALVLSAPSLGGVLLDTTMIGDLSDAATVSSFLSRLLAAPE